MAWTSPATWSVSEIVTAAKMNTHVRDNLAYLHGDAGTIAFAAGATFAGNVTAASQLRGQGAAPGMWLDETDGPTKGAFLALDSGLLQLQRRATAFGAFEATVAQIDITAPASSLVIDGDGDVGFGVATPRGVIHAYDTIAGMIKWEFDGLAGVAQTVIANGAGDVQYAATFTSLVRSSGGTIQAFASPFTSQLTPGGGGATIFSSGGDTVTISCAADGSVTVQRTAGTLTYKISLLMHWL